MSRIEEAMELAVRQRDRENQTPGEKAGPAPVPPAPPAPSGTRPVSRVDPGRPAAAIDRTNPYLVTLDKDRSPVAEEYRKLKEALVKDTKTSTFLNTIMVTSPQVGEGKTITSCNLAICLAQELDHTVLLVDADLRRSACARYLGLPAGPGLTECLTQGLDLAEALVRTDVDGLSLLPAGAEVPNPAELLASQAMQGLLHQIKHRYPDRYVIIDTPPVLPFAETRTIGSLSDAVLLVVKEGVSSPADIQDALEALRGDKVLGLVYNQAENLPQSASSYYSSAARRG